MQPTCRKRALRRPPTAAVDPQRQLYIVDIDGEILRIESA
jgi:hypothetical protein